MVDIRISGPATVAHTLVENEVERFCEWPLSIVECVLIGTLCVATHLLSVYSPRDALCIPFYTIYVPIGHVNGFIETRLWITFVSERVGPIRMYGVVSAILCVDSFENVDFTSLGPTFSRWCGIIQAARKLPR